MKYPYPPRSCRCAAIFILISHGNQTGNCENDLCQSRRRMRFGLSLAKDA